MSKPVSTCDLCDAQKADASGSFRVLPPVFRDFGAVSAFHGPVVTIKDLNDYLNYEFLDPNGGFGKGDVELDAKLLQYDQAVQELVNGIFFDCCDCATRLLCSKTTAVMS